MDALVDMMKSFIDKMGQNLKSENRNVDRALSRSGVCTELFDLVKWYKEWLIFFLGKFGKNFPFGKSFIFPGMKLFCGRQ